MYGSTTKGGVVKRSDCILVHGSITKGDVVKRSDCYTDMGSTVLFFPVHVLTIVIVCTEVRWER